MADVLSEAAEKLMLVPDPDVHLECSGLSFLGLSHRAQGSGLQSLQGLMPMCGTCGVSRNFTVEDLRVEGLRFGPSREVKMLQAVAMVLRQGILQTSAMRAPIQIPTHEIKQPQNILKPEP